MDDAMETVRVVGIVMIALSVLLLAGSFIAYARHRLTENFGMIWGIVSVSLLIMGIVLTVIKESFTAVSVIAIILGVLLVAALFGFSQAISVMIMKNQELAMQISLLNQENEGILQELTTKKEKEAQ